MNELWRATDLTNPHAAADKAARVRGMFAAIAPTYDLNNRLHSLWRDQAWRRAAVRMAGLRSTDRVMDIACGTGDLSIAFAHALTMIDDLGDLRGRVVGMDFTPEMLSLARAKWLGDARRGEHARPSPDDAAVRDMIRWAAADAMRLPAPDACCDVVSIAFGLRNVADPARALAEFHRVLRPGGRLIILEFSTPTNPVFRHLSAFYTERIMPVTATWIARDRTGAYRYLPRSVSTFLSPRATMQAMEEAGFTEVVARPLTLGIATIYRGVKAARFTRVRDTTTSGSLRRPSAPPR